MPMLEGKVAIVTGRRLFEARPRPPVPYVGRVEERSIDGPGGSLRLRIYTSATGSAPRPLLVFYHGSGFLLCNFDTHDGICRNDRLEATRWAAANADALGTIPGFIVIGGDSAGGNMAAVTALRCRDANSPALADQLLIYPVTDHYAADYPSYTENAEGYGLSRSGMRWFWDHYLAWPEQGADPLASPMRAADLAGLPPALVLTAEFDPLRDEGKAYGARLERAGVATRIVRLDGANHGFFALTGCVAKADAAMAMAVDWWKTQALERAC